MAFSVWAKRHVSTWFEGRVVSTAETSIYLMLLLVCVLCVCLTITRRTSYSSVTQSRSYLPDEVGALLWVAQYKPSVSTFVPFYVAMHEVRSVGHLKQTL